MKQFRWILAVLLVLGGFGQAVGQTWTISVDTMLVQDSGSATELLIDNTAADGDVVLGFELGGTRIWSIGGDDGDSDKFKIGTTAIGTGTWFEWDGTTLTLTGQQTVGVDDTGYDVQFFGATSGAYVLWDESADQLLLTASTYRQTAGNMYLGDTANGNMTQGLTLNQGASDDEAIAFKSSDVAHGMTTRTETDTWGHIEKHHDTGGGVSIYGYTDTDGNAYHALVLTGRLGEAASTDDTNTSDGVVGFRAQIKSGTTTGAVAASGNAFSWDNANTTLLLMKGDGSLHATNVTSGSGDLDGVALDFENDYSLLRAHERLVHNDAGIRMEEWDRNVNLPEQRQRLIDIGVWSSDGSFYNVQRMASLQNGTIHQNFTNINRNAESIDLVDEKVSYLMEQNRILQAAIAHLGGNNANN